MRWLIAILLAVAAPTTAREPMIVLSGDTEARWVDFELTPHNQIRFTLDLDGQPVRAMLDTAASSSAVSPALAARMHLPIHIAGTVAAIGGSMGAGWTESPPIAFGGLHRRGGRLAVIDLPPGATGSNRAVTMLIGADLLSTNALEIDYPARRFRLLPSGRMPFRGKHAPLMIGTPQSFYATEIMIAGQRLRPIIVDTGDGGAVTVAGPAWHPPDGAGIPTTSTLIQGLAGPAVSDLLILPEMRLGTLTAREIELHIERGDGYSSRTGVSGRIGSGFLRDYHILLDPAAGHMVLDPAAASAPSRSTSGLLVQAQGKALVVVHVMKGGPGEATGWRDGDRICTVDGGPVTTDWLAGAPGRTVSLGLCDGAARRLTLRRFY